MKNKKIMVTGGAGFIGSHLIDKLLENGNEVWAFDHIPIEDAKNLNAAKQHKNFNYFIGDIKEPASIKRFYQKDADVIFHLASVVGIKNYVEDPFNLVDVIVLGTRYFLEHIIENNTRLVYASTSEIFGKNPVVPWSEDDDRVLGSTSISRWSYSSSKAVCEHMIFGAYHKFNMPFTIVRFFNVYGPRQNPIFVVSQTISKIIKNERPLMYDDGKMTRCYTYIDDVIRGLILCTENDGALGQAINLGNSVETNVKTIIETALKLSGTSLEYDVLDTKYHYGDKYEDIIRRVPSVKKAYELLGWKAQIQIEEGIKNTILWARNNRDWAK